MCGISGILSYGANPREDILSMNEGMIRRGPDGQDIFIDEKHRVALGHRRLAIIDVSSAGSQPMVSLSKRYVIVFNGEIYNASELKQKLTNEVGPMPFRGHSDTEILLEAAAHWGLKQTLNMAKGMWGIALFDRESGEVMLTRDRMGEKPLYFGRVKDSFVFASNLNAISRLAFFDNKINEQVLGTYFKNGYIPAPYSIYEDIYKLEPGSILTIRPPYKEWSIEKYYDIAAVAKKGQDNLFEGSINEAEAELERLLKDAIRGQMLSDVPLGAFLSGGIDSTLVVSLMQALSDKPVRTFTIGFNEEKYNEAKYASETAKHLGTKHTEMYVGYSDVLSLLEELPECFGEPFADSSELPTMLVSRMTRQHVTVALSGDAGDEFYCGYNIYKDAAAGLSVLQSKLPFIKGPLRSGLGKLILSSPAANVELLRTAGRCFSAATVEDFYRAVRDDDVRAGRLPRCKAELPTAMTQYVDGSLHGNENNLMLMDMLQYLPDDILVKVDRSGMHYSLESRIPLLDRDVMEFAWTLPLEYKMYNLTTKRILRNILYKYVPKEMMDRPKKGFSVPVSIWLREGRMREWAEDTLSTSRPLLSQYLDIKLVDSIWNNYINGGDWNALVWYLLVFASFIEKRHL